ncbi:MAG: DUF1257 domain-containing protein [Vulcanimicrobiota bacterium]
MSVVFVVVPVVMAYPALLAAAVAVASSSGFTLVEQTARSAKQMVETIESCEEIEMESREELTKVIEAEGSFTLEKEDLLMIFSKSRNTGKVSLFVKDSGKRSKEELRSIASETMNRIIQRYAYDSVMKELKKDGYKVVEEHTEEDASIKLKVRKW